MLIQFIRTAPDTQASNVAGTAIQELLKVCGCTTPSLFNRKLKSALEVWGKFDEDEKTLLFPFLSSQYQVVQQPPPSGRFFDRSETFQKWIGDWSVFLASRLPEDHQAMFEPCRLAMRWDSRLALFLLPHLLLRVGLHGNSGVLEAIREEMNCVVGKAALDESNVLRNAKVTVNCKFFIVHFSDQLLQKEEMQQMATQTIFSLMDELMNWCQDQQMRSDQYDHLQHEIDETSDHVKYEKYYVPISFFLLPFHFFLTRSLFRNTHEGNFN